MGREVTFSPEARQDLFALYEFIADRDGENRAVGYIERIEGFCTSLSIFPDRGAQRDALRPGLRVIGFERRVTIAFHVTIDAVIIDRILYGGRSLHLAFERDR